MTDISSPKPRSALRRGVIALTLVGGGFVLGAGTLAVAATGEAPWHGGFHHHARIGFFQHMVRGALDNVGATTTQEDKIHDIIATTYTQLDADQAGRETMRKQLLDLMKAPTVDRAAIEKLRAEKVSEFDAKSKKIADALVDAAGQLSPEQRAKLVQNVEDRMDHGWGWGRWHHHDRMDQDGHDSGDGPGDQEDHG